MPETLASHIAAILSPSCSLSIQLPANDVGKVEEDGPSALVPATHKGDQGETHGCGLAQLCPWSQLESEPVDGSSLPMPLILQFIDTLFVCLFMAKSQA